MNQTWVKDLRGTQYLFSDDENAMCVMNDNGKYYHGFADSFTKFPIEMPTEGLKKITHRARQYMVGFNFAELYGQTFKNYKHGK